MHGKFANREWAGGEFIPYFQPILDLRRGAVAGFELLARLDHPVRGIVGPETFIGAAEKEGWIDDLTLELLAKAVPAFARLPGDPFLAVNISAVQLHNFALPERVRDFAEAAAFPLDRLTLEVTETSLPQDLGTAREVAERFRGFGCGLALDDFGTGHSSMTMLQALPFHALKVDRSFVGTMAESRGSRKIVAAIIGLGQSLGITTIAEGVETQEQNEMIDWLGCDFAQGWFHGKPVPAEALAAVYLEPRSKPAQRRVPETHESRRSLSRFDHLPHVRLAQLRSVYDAVPAGLAFVDRNQRYLTVNQRMADINGVGMVDHFDRTVSEMVPEIYPQVAPDLLRALRGESVTGAVVEGRTHPAKPSRKYFVTYEPAHDEGGEVVGASIAVLEIDSIDVHVPPALQTVAIAR